MLESKVVPKIKAAIYIRVSTEDQAREGFWIVNTKLYKLNENTIDF